MKVVVVAAAAVVSGRDLEIRKQVQGARGRCTALYSRENVMLGGKV